MPLRSREITKRNSAKRSAMASPAMDYQTLEPRKLLATLTVDTLSDVVDLSDGLVSLREAITATNTNAAFGDAGAGDENGDIIRFAPSIAGGTIELNGSELEITDDLIFRGGGVHLDGDSSSRIFSINTSENVLIGDTTFTDGFGPSGGAINHRGGGTLQIFNSQFEDNRSFGNGGAISSSQGQLLIGRSVFEDNRSLQQSGGAISVFNGRSSFFQTTFEDNLARVDGGAVSVIDSDLFSNETDFISNRAVNSGGAVHIEGSESSSVFTANTVEENRALSGGGFYLAGGAGSFIVSSTLQENTAGMIQPFPRGGDGGAIETTENLVVRDSFINDNISINGTGGGIDSDGGDLRLTNVEVNENRSRLGGNGVATFDANLFVIDSSVSNNRFFRTSSDEVLASDLEYTGGGIQFETDRLGELSRGYRVVRSTISGNVSIGNGGGIAGENGNHTIIDSVIEDNTVIGGGRGRSLTNSGGGLYQRIGGLDIRGTTIAGNRLLAQPDDRFLSSGGSGGGLRALVVDLSM